MSAESAAQLTIVGPRDDVEALQSVLNERRLECHNTPLPAQETVLPFTFESLIALVVALGGGGIIASAAKCIVSYLKERKRKLTIQSSSGGFEVVSENFSPEELERLLASLPPTAIALVVKDARERS